jgi:outer membrane biosynthesis protein TonB
LTPPVEVPRKEDAPPPPPEPKPVAPPPTPPTPTTPTQAPTTPDAPAPRTTEAPKTPTPPTPAPAAPSAPQQPPAATNGGGVASTERSKGGPNDLAPGDAGRAGGQGASPVPGQGGQGALSDLESPATSLIRCDAKDWKNGRLIPARGIQLKPRKPDLTLLTGITSMSHARNPVVAITFDGTGKCTAVKILQTSGYEEIDGPVTDCLFWWRADGKQIRDLKKGETVTVTLQLLL